MKIIIAERWAKIGSSGSQRIQEIYVENDKIWLGLDYGYNIGMNIEDTKKLIDLLTHATTVIENENKK